MCSAGQECRKTYLSQRELEAHISYRHKTAEKLKCAPLKKVHPRIASPTTEIPEMLLDQDHMSHIPPELPSIMSPSPVQRVSHKRSIQPREDLYAPPAELLPPHLLCSIRKSLVLKQENTAI